MNIDNIYNNRKNLYNLCIYKSIPDSIFTENISCYRQDTDNNNSSPIKIALLILESNFGIEGFTKYYINSFLKNINRYNYSFKIFLSSESIYSCKKTRQYLHNLLKDHKIDIEFFKQNSSLVQSINQLYIFSFDQGYNYFHFSFDYIEFSYKDYFLDCINNLKSKNDIGISGSYTQFNQYFLENFIISRQHMKIFGFLFPKEIEDNGMYQWICNFYKEDYYNPLEIKEVKSYKKLSDYEYSINNNDINTHILTYRNLINILSKENINDEDYSKGNLIIIKNLNNNRIYNGLLGCLHEFNKDKGKYKIKLLNKDKYLLLKQDHLYNFFDEIINIIHFFIEIKDFNPALKLLLPISNSDILNEKKAYFLFLIAKCKEGMEYNFERYVLPEYINTFNFRKSRIEPLYHIMLHYKKKKNYNSMLSYGMLGYPIKDKDSFNIQYELYTYLFYYELAEAAFKIQIYELAYDLYSILILNNNHPDHLMGKIIHNLKYCVKQLNINLPNNKYCIL